ncbi:TolC family protein [Candidatus Sumerlaeota bacterium]|nr:TolC family protein [Candidatus Sumerlaeota bacterium]
MINIGKLPVIIALSILATSCFYHVPMPPDEYERSISLEEGRKIAERKAKETRLDLPADQPTSMTISRDGAILTTLSRNRSLMVERFNPRIAATRAPELAAQFDPLLMATASMGRSKVPVNEAQDRILSRNMGIDGRIVQYFPSGADVFLAGGFTRDRTEEPDWNYTGSWSVGVNQALLRGASSDVNLISIVQARNSEKISSYELDGFLLELVLKVELAYWDLVLAKEKVKIREFSVKLAEEQLQLNNDFILVGKLSPDARVYAEAELASRQADLVDAQADVRAKTIDLIRLFDPKHEDQWSIVFDTADPPEVEIVQINPAVSARLTDLYRPELSQVRLDQVNKKLEVVRARNGLLPKLDAFASYGRLSSGDSSSDAARYLDDSDFDNYEVGLNFELSPANRAEKARHERAKLEEERARAAISNLAQLIEAEVRRAVIEAQRQAQRIPATGKVVESREEELRIEKSRFRVGLSTNLDVLRIERDFIQAQLDELTARVRYIQSLSALYYSEGTLLLRRGVDAGNQ